MTKVKLTIIVDLDDNVYLLRNQEEVDWLFTEILSDRGTLILHSNDIGDTVGPVSKVENVHFVD